MDLSNLQQTLPPDLADAERAMGEKFRAAALSITNLYKSSLSATQQAYNAGYNAALNDMLSMVQSSLGEGQDSAQTLSRLMDWADARKAAISAFAAEEAEDTSAISKPRPNPISRQSHLAPQRPPYASTAVGSSSRPNSSRRSSDVVEDRTAGGLSKLSEQGLSATPSRPGPGITTNYQPTPNNLLSSPLDSPSVRPQSQSSLVPSTKPSRGLPIRFNHQSQVPPSSSTFPTPPSTLPLSTFNPSTPHISSVRDIIAADVPGQDFPIGVKRPMIENMEVEESPSTVGATRIGRSSKRRSLGINSIKDEEERSGERGRRGGRRHGHGGGHGSASAGI